jgi:hypothetical protein
MISYLQRQQFFTDQLVVIVFSVGNTPINKSKFPPHIALIIVIEATTTAHSNDLSYKVSVISRGLYLSSTLPSPPIFPHDENFPSFLSWKIINFYRTAMYYPPISKSIETIRSK